MEIKKNDSLNFMDVCVQTLCMFNIQKTASFNAFAHRFLLFPLSQNDLWEEINTIKFITIKNG